MKTLNRLAAVIAMLAPWASHEALGLQGNGSVTAGERPAFEEGRDLGQFLALNIPHHRGGGEWLQRFLDQRDERLELLRRERLERLELLRRERLERLGLLRRERLELLRRLLHERGENGGEGCEDVSPVKFFLCR